MNLSNAVRWRSVVLVVSAGVLAACAAPAAASAKRYTVTFDAKRASVSASFENQSVCGGPIYQQTETQRLSFSGATRITTGPGTFVSPSFAAPVSGEDSFTVTRRDTGRVAAPAKPCTPEEQTTYAFEAGTSEVPYGETKFIGRRSLPLALAAHRGRLVIRQTMQVAICGKVNVCGKEWAFPEEAGIDVDQEPVATGVTLAQLDRIALGKTLTVRKTMAYSYALDLPNARRDFRVPLVVKVKRTA